MLTETTFQKELVPLWGKMKPELHPRKGFFIEPFRGSFQTFRRSVSVNFIWEFSRKSLDDVIETLKFEVNSQGG